MGRKIGLVLDAADPRALGAFWSFALDAYAERWLREFDETPQGQWIVMNDPEGNEFCVV
ncbi:MAG TPA: hypothetical protein VIQ78_00280 [Terrimesophilobacter sp.]|uniref:hypothetical protein n=1 Tax=Terrimesophilobacter sp. TaxID=2906435 RepID=UPI002F9317B1